MPNPTATALRAAAAYRAGDVDGALAALRVVVEATDNAEARRVLGMLLVVAGRHDEALATLSALPESHDTLLALAKAHAGRDDLHAARECAARAVALEPTSNDARVRLAAVDSVLGMRGAAVAKAEHPIPAGRDLPGFTMLRDGDFNGFRWLAEVLKPHTDRPGGHILATVGRDVPIWEGQHVARLVVILDQGFGDCLQYCRWLPAVREHCDHLTVISEPALHGLLTDYESLATTEMDRALVRADAYSPASLLPAVLPLDYAPAGGYLSAKPLELPAGFKVGVCWAGNPQNPTDAFRSATSADIEPLRVEGATYYSLMQRDHDRPEWIAPPPIPLIDYAATARLVAALDLVVSVDTSVAHLAGALGKPVWIALAEPACWRWERHPSRSNWYASATLFRQHRDWREVFERVGASLANAIQPWCVTGPFLNLEECSRLLAVREWQRGRIGGGKLDEQHRACDEAMLDPADPDLAWLFERLPDLVAQANALLGTQATALAEPPILARYKAGDRFNWHLDTGKDANRALSLSVPLTAVCEGGNLLVMQPEGARWIGSSGEPGTAVLFPADVLHTVTPVERGERVALVVWFR